MPRRAAVGLCGDGFVRARTDPDGPPAGPWGPTIEKRKNTTVVERGKSKGTGVKLVALLTGDGQQIDQGLVWRVFQYGTDSRKIEASNGVP